MPSLSRFRKRLDFPDELEEAVQPRLYLLLILLALLVAYIIAFALENSTARPVHFVFGTANVSLTWLILLTLVLGLIGGVAISQLARHRQRGKRLKQRPQALDTGSDLGGLGVAVGQPGGTPAATPIGEEVGT